VTSLPSRERRRTRERGLLLLLLPLLALLTAGCVDLPTNSGVNPLDKQSNAGGGADVRIWPQGPQKDDSPEGTVEHFLQTASSDPSNRAIAEAYLTGDARSKWDPSKVLIFSGDVSSARSTGGGNVTITGTEVATISDSGAYQTVPNPEPQQPYPFHLVHDPNKGYQIDQLPDSTFGIALTQEAFRANYTAYSLYYLNQDSSTTSMIPVTVYQRSPSGDVGVADGLANALLNNGPPAWLAGVAGNAVPGVQTAPGQSVTIGQDGTASVPVKTPNHCTMHSKAACSRLADQLLATFSPLASISRVDVVDAKGDLLGTSLMMDALLRAYHIVGSPPRNLSFYYLDAATHRIFYYDSHDGSSPVPFGPADRKYAQLAVADYSGPTVAAVDSTGTNLYVGATGTAGGATKAAWTGHNIRSLSWDAFGHLWFIDTVNGQPVVRRLDITKGFQAEPQAIKVLGITDSPVEEVTVAPDGRRVAVVYGDPPTGQAAPTSSSLAVGVLDENPLPTALDLSVGSQQPVLYQWANITAVDWHGSQAFAVLGYEESSLPLVIDELNPDGSPVLNSSDLNAVSINPPKGATGLEWTGSTLLASYSTGEQGNPPSSYAIEQYAFATNTWELVKNVSGTMPTYVD